MRRTVPGSIPMNSARLKSAKARSLCRGPNAESGGLRTAVATAQANRFRFRSMAARLSGQQRWRGDSESRVAAVRPGCDNSESLYAQPGRTGCRIRSSAGRRADRRVLSGCGWFAVICSESNVRKGVRNEYFAAPFSPFGYWFLPPSRILPGTSVQDDSSNEEDFRCRRRGRRGA